MKTLLIATHRRGFECDPVIDELGGKVPLVRFNCEDAAAASLVSVIWEPGSRKSSVIFKCDGRTVKSSDVGAGWFQQIPPFVGQPQTEEQTLQNENLSAAYLGSLQLLDIPWMNSPSGVIRASNKVLQLEAALASGLRIPNTAITNDPKVVEAMSLGGQVVVKNLATPWIIGSTEETAAFTSLLEPSWLKDSDGITSCPAIYQSFHPRKYDYRVVVVGSRTFAARCTPKKHQLVDIRHGATTDHSYEPCVLEERYIDGLKGLMSHFDLDYCSADFMEDEKGDIYFLDLNSCGAWWWIDEIYGGKIKEALCAHLLSILANE